MVPIISEFKKDLFKYVKFVFGGGLSLMLNLLVTYALTEFVHIWHMLSFGIALLVELLFLFGYHSRITFNKKGNFLTFAAIILFISGLNWIFVYLLSEIFEVYYLVSIILVAVIISFLNYALNNKIVFKH
jgi:putative flippase GtrA